MKDLVTKDSLKELLEDPDRDFVETVVGRALWNIFLRQTNSEQITTNTSDENGVGFSSYDARSGSISAKYFRKHGHLGRCSCKGNYRDGHKRVDDSENWRADTWLKAQKNGYPRICKYVKQLNEIANERANETTAEKEAREAKESGQAWSAVSHR